MALAHQTYEDDDVKASVTLDILTPYLTPPDGSKHRSVKAFVNTIPVREFRRVHLAPTMSMFPTKGTI